MNTIDPIWIWVALGAAALLIVAALVSRAARRARTESLRNAFGREYDHTVHEAGSRKRAERELLARKEEVERYEIRPLTAAERERYRADWQKVEQHFIERPTMAVVEADELVAEVMRVQGYPMGDFEKYAAHLSVKHPRIVEHYRAGHSVITGAPGSASTEDLRQAMLHYRALFDELLDGIPATTWRGRSRPRRRSWPSRGRKRPTSCAATIASSGADRHVRALLCFGAEAHRVFAGETGGAVEGARIVVALFHRLEQSVFAQIAEGVGLDEVADLVERVRGADELRPLRCVDAVVAGP